MKIVIIEDEKPAAEKLKKAIAQYDSSIQLLAVLGSSRSASEWFQQNPGPDLVFMDIELTDGLSFQIFDQCVITCPIIFTTAYDEYWQESFDYNSIDYLLKPIKQDNLENAINKYKKLQQHFTTNYAALFQELQLPNRSSSFRKRFLVKKGIDLVSIRTDEIAYCYAAHKLSFIVDHKAQQFILDKSLTDLEKELDPALFFRINRKYLLNIHHIRRVKTHSKSKLLVELNPAPGEEIIVSQENTASFKKWMDS
jgi:two-component system, LytTR family, response regulator